jgi:hypothetical protein
VLRLSATNLRRLRYAVTLIVLVMALFVSTEYALLNVNAVPSLTVTPNSGPIGQGVTVTGSGFSLSDVGACTSMLSSPVNIVSASTCNFAHNGVLIGSSFTVVAGAALGVYFVTVTGSTGDFATASFTVTPPTITLTPNSGPIGQGVTVTGSGFAPGDAGACTSVLSTPTNIVSAPTCTINVSGQ